MGNLPKRVLKFINHTIGRIVQKIAFARFLFLFNFISASAQQPEYVDRNPGDSSFQNKPILKPFLLLLVLSIPFLAASQNSEFRALDQVLNQYEKKDKTMGSIAISENGKNTYSRAWGFSNLSLRTAADTLTRYRIGSVSKMITATMILQLVAENKLSLHQKLSHFFPKWPNSDQITIEHLLRHQSGLYNFGKSRSENYRENNPKTRKDIASIFEKAPISFSPGERIEYNNANYVVLSLILEDIDGTTFEASLQARILKPLSLKNTHAGGFIDSTQNEAFSYHWKNKWRANADHYSFGLLGAGALVSTPNDLNQFLHALFHEALLPKEQFQQMKEVQNGMGLGLYAYPFADWTGYGHSGNIDSFESFSAYFPEKDLCVSIVLNANRRDFNKVLIDCLSAYLGY